MRRPPAEFALREFLREVYIPSRLDLCPQAVRQMEISIRCLKRWAAERKALTPGPSPGKGRGETPPLTLADLSEDLLRQFLAAYRAQGRAASTVNSKRCQLLALWRSAWEEEYLPTPPRARKIRKARGFPLAPEAWTAAEVGRILAAVATIPGTTGGLPTAAWWSSLLLVLYDTGARKGEALATRQQDVSLTGAWIALASRKNGRRICPLHAETVAAIRPIYPLTLDSQPSTLLWPWPFTREALDKRFRKILAAAGVAYGRGRGGLFHKLRRTSGTLVEAAGGDGARQIGDTRTVFERHYGIEAAQVALGHARANITEVYAEKNMEQAQRIAKEMG